MEMLEACDELREVISGALAKLAENPELTLAYTVFESVEGWLNRYLSSGAYKGWLADIDADNAEAELDNGIEMRCSRVNNGTKPYIRAQWLKNKLERRIEKAEACLNLGTASDSKIGAAQLRGEIAAYEAVIALIDSDSIRDDAVVYIEGECEDGK